MGFGEGAGGGKYGVGEGEQWRLTGVFDWGGLFIYFGVGLVVG